MLRAFLFTLCFSSACLSAEEGTPLPEAPKADPKSEHKALQPDKSLILETKPDGTKRVLVAAQVCLREGPLELFACKKKSKEHEAIVAIDLDAQFIHAALVAAGAKPGKPVQFVDPKTQESDYKPASGGKILVSVHYTQDGKAVTMKAQEWIQDMKTKKPMAHDWVFAGSRLVKNPEKPDSPPVYTANLGEIISISNFTDSMLELPVKSSNVNDDLLFGANTEKIPPLLTKVWIILEPEAEKK
ncbi:hypothetical protein BH11PLA2_BH11PLA2_33250 [soil metagenome]